MRPHAAGVKRHGAVRHTGAEDMRKEFEIQGCIEVRPEVTADEFWEEFIGFVESRGWSFGGGINEIQYGYYILPDGSRGQHVLGDRE